MACLVGMSIQLSIESIFRQGGPSVGLWGPYNGRR